MQADHYYGSYARFDTTSKKDASVLLGSDCIVGDRFDIEIAMEQGTARAWVRNRFGSRIGYLDAPTSHTLSVLAAREWTLCALLSFVAFTDNPEPGRYWGEAALICFDPRLDDAFEPFITATGKRLGNGIRPAIDFSNQAVESVISSKGTWQPRQTVPFPAGDKGTAIIKRERGMMDAIVEKSRSGNKGCYVASWAFLLALVALVLVALKSCGVF